MNKSNFSEFQRLVDTSIDNGQYELAIQLLQEELAIQPPARLELQNLELAFELRVLGIANQLSERYPDNSAVLYFFGRLLFNRHSDTAALTILNKSLLATDVDVSTQIMVRYYRARCALRLGAIDELRSELLWLSNAKSNTTKEIVAEGLEPYLALAICETTNTTIAPGLAKLAEISSVKHYCENIAQLLHAKVGELVILGACEHRESK